MSAATSIGSRRAMAAGLAAALAVLGGGCASAVVRPTAGTTTTTLLPASFCDPIRSLSVEMWAEDGPRTKVVTDLESARAHAPEGMTPVLDALLALERDEAGAVPGTTVLFAQDRWFAAMDALADVAERECGVDIAAGAPDTPSGTAAPGPPRPPGTPVGPAASGLTFDAVVAQVRAARPDAPWTDQPLTGTVGDGETVQVDIEGVDDVATALVVCEDLLAVLPTRAQHPKVAVRSTAGVILAVGEAGGCFDTPHL